MNAKVLTHIVRIYAFAISVLFIATLFGDHDWPRYLRLIVFLGIVFSVVCAIATYVQNQDKRRL